MRRAASCWVRRLALFVMFAAAAGATAQTYTSKPVRIVVGFAAGGSVDVLARIVAQKLGEFWGQSVIVENRVGAGGNIATDVVAKAPPDGYTLLLHTSAIAVNVSLYKNLPFDTLHDLAPIMTVGSTNGVLLVPASLPAQSVKEMIALAKSESGKLAYATTGNGSSGHLFMALFLSLAGVDALHVPYKTISQMYTDLISGRVQMSINTLPGAIPHINSGKLRALAVTGGRRAELYPDLRTMQEAGVPRYEATTWYGAFAPAGTPGAVVAKINADIQRLLGLADVRQRFAAAGLDPQGDTPEQFAKYFRDEIAKWATVVKTTGMQAD
jgi:tripartite-type tricarboxylate transporter receptor subunit TctC